MSKYIVRAWSAAGDENYSTPADTLVEARAAQRAILSDASGSASATIYDADENAISDKKRAS